MEAELVIETTPDSTGVHTPHLSYSRVSRYLLCPEQYRLYYVENLRPRLPPASLEFGKAIHAALAACFTEGQDAVTVFGESWDALKNAELRYACRESWEKLRERGQELLKKFFEEELPRLGTVHASEKPFELVVSNLDLPFVGIIDLVADVDNKLTVVDFKTSASKYQDYEVELSDQLTAYQLAEPAASQSALCVLVKTTEPRIDWYFSRRTGSQLAEYLQKVSTVGQQIATRVFYKRPGKHCAYCDFLVSCLGDEQAVQEDLVKAA